MKSVRQISKDIRVVNFLNTEDDRIAIQINDYDGVTTVKIHDPKEALAVAKELTEWAVSLHVFNLLTEGSDTELTNFAHMVKDVLNKLDSQQQGQFFRELFFTANTQE